MVRGGHARPPRAADRLRSKGPAIAKNKFAKNNKHKNKQHKPVSLKNQIRSAERLLRKNPPPKIKDAQEKRLEELKNQLELQNRLAIEREISLRYRKIKFFERRKIERMIRRLEKQQRTSADHNLDLTISEQLAKLKEDLEYVRFFPKTEKYISLFVGDNIAEVVEKRERLRQQIKDNLAAAAAHGKDLEAYYFNPKYHYKNGLGTNGDLLSAVQIVVEKLVKDEKLQSMCMNEVKYYRDALGSFGRITAVNGRGNTLPETASDDDELLGLSEDDFFMSHSSNADADDEWTDKSAREPVSSASGKATCGTSKERNQKYVADKVMMPHFSRHSSKRAHDYVKIPAKGHKITKKPEYSVSIDTSYSQRRPLSGHGVLSNARVDHSSNLSSNSDARRTRRKRRPKKKKTVKD